MDTPEFQSTTEPMRLKHHINEASKTTIYHGDNFATTKLSPKLMNNGNNQVGIGIYFGDLKIATAYGKNIISIDINPRDFKDGMSDIDSVINTKQAVKIIEHLHKNDPDFWYIFSDYVGVADHDEVEDYHYDGLWDAMRSTEARNWQIEMTQATNVDNFVTAWNKYTKIHGLYESFTGFYSVINTRYKVTKVKP
jgi:hypothetical protein